MADDALSQFCGSEFWNNNLTWYTDSPQLTSCFDETVLVWVPCCVLAALLPFDIYTSSHSRSRNIQWNWRSLLKLVFCSINVVSSVLDILAPLKWYFEEQTVYPVQFFTPFLRILSVASCICLIPFHRLKGVRTSGALFFFWFFVVVCGISQTSNIFRHWNEGMNFHDINFLVYYFSSVLVFVLQFCADIEPLEDDDPKVERPCPEFQSSFITRLTFSWYESLAYLGFKRPLLASDLWSLRYEDTTASIFPKVNKYWEEILDKSSKKTAEHVGNGVGPKNASTRKGKPASILPALVRTFWPIYLFGCILKLGQDLTGFISPQLLKFMIAFIESDDPVWKGYFYAFLMFISAIVQTMFQSHCMYHLLMVGRRQRSAIISLVYRKALRLSNAARRQNTLGEIVNLMAVDAQKFFDVTTHFVLLWSGPIQITLAMYFLWQNLGPSVLAGLAVMLLMIPINGVIANKLKKLQMKQMKNKDQRAKLMNEILNGIKVLKLYAWEPSFEQQIHKIRDKEVKVLREAAYFGAATSFLWSCTPFLVTLVTFAVYVLVDENNILDASKAFVSLSLFNLLRMPISMLPMMISSVVQTKVSLDRLNKFMNSEELDPDAVSHNEKEEDPIIIENGSFKWEPEGELILKNINLRVKSNSLVAVVGAVGCGKSSLVAALLGEMEKLSGRVNVRGRISYVPQSAWILNNTLQDNIIFGEEYHRRNYQRVIEACALKADFEMLPMGDQTEIGEKGINLSGGQKQRVSLARAIYCDADIYYLDDPLSAVDSHVGKHIFENVIGSSGLLRNKTRIFITHGITHLHDVDLVVVLKDGGISEIGTFQELIDKKGEFSEFLNKHLQDVGPEELEELDENLKNQLMVRQLSTISEASNMSRKPSKGSQKSLDEIPLKGRGKNLLIQEERAQVGGVKLSVYKEYFKTAGPFLVLLTLLMTIANQGLGVGSNIWLSVWSTDQNLVINGTQDTSKRDLYLGIYAALGFSQIGGTVVANLAMAMGGIHAAVGVHKFLLSRIFHAPISFFDVTPAGRILSRCGKDTEVIDNSIANVLNMALSRLVAVIATLLVISYSSPTFIIVMLPVGCLYYFILRIHIATSRQLKRLESLTRAPIYSHFGESVQGTSVLRAFHVQERFIKESEHRVDLNQVCAYPSMIAHRWLGQRLEIIGSIVVFSTAVFAVLGRDTLSAGLVGLSLSYALQITQALNWMVRMTADVETNIVAVERIIEYKDAPQEAPWEITPNIAQNDWPKEGRVEFKDYDVRYREGLELVLKGISFNIKGGEKIGIVGRTGAGKSSMTLSLFRIIEAAGGFIEIDGIKISELGLHALRSRLTIIPQDPVLFSGTLRMNLDPFEKYTDDQVWESLELSHLKNFVSGLSAKLQHEVSEGGENLSLGQRQLICLARALLRKTKVLVLDEATAAIDLETDDLIQKTIRSEFASCTVLTIAHRLNTIMDSDRVLVLDQGTVVEFDPPAVLLQRKTSIFYSMAKDAGLVS